MDKEAVKYLENNGYSISEDEAGMIITNPANGNQFGVYEAGGWVQFGMQVFSGSEIINHNPLYKLLLKLQNRLIGCRFSIDDYSNLVVIVDIYPEQQESSLYSNVLNQVEWVLERVLPLLKETNATGKIPEESVIDYQFELIEKH